MNKREQKPLTPAAGRETDLVKSQQPLSSPGEKEKMSHSLDHLIGLSSDTKKDHSNQYLVASFPDIKKKPKITCKDGSVYQIPSTWITEKWLF